VECPEVGVGGGGDSGLTWNHDLLGVVCGKGVAVWLVRDPAWGTASASRISGSLSDVEGAPMSAGVRGGSH
jgi:hypothetical protein